VSNGHNQRQFWFPLPGNFYLDEEMVILPPLAQLLLVRVIALCATLQTGGRVTGGQLRNLSHDLCAKPARLVDSLVQTGSLRVDTGRTNRGQAGTDSGQLPDPFDPDQDELWTDPGSTQTDPGHSRDKKGPFGLDYVLAQSTKWLEDYAGHRRKGAGQGRDDLDGEQASPPRARGGAPARKTHTQTHTSVTSRPASPDGRDVTGPARDAPRRAAEDGAAQRPPDVGPGKFGSFPGQYRGPVRVQPDFAGPRRPVAADHAAATVTAKVDARAKLEQFIRQFPQHSNSDNANGHDPVPVWEAFRNVDGGDGESMAGGGIE
jgi:hypothetical protein